MNRGLTTKEFTEIAKKGMEFYVLYNKFNNYPFQAYDVITYVKSIDCICMDTCKYIKNGYCKGEGVFRRKDGIEKSMCMSWYDRGDISNCDIGDTYLISVYKDFIEENEFSL